MKKIVLNIILILVLIFSLTGCSNNSENTANTNVTTTSSQNQVKNEANNQTSSQTVEDPFKDFNFKTAAEKQMALPEEGETIAILKVKDYGDIKVKFFEEVAPKAVENFITHAKNGYYNGVTFHRVIQDFMIQGGDPEGTGRGGESIWGKGFPEEFDIGLVPYRGSLCMASAGVGTSSLGSQFFITQAKYSETMSTYLRQGGYPEGLLEQYKEYDGYMSLYLQYTVFGQVFEGMDVVDKIAMIETETTKEGQEDKPVKDVIIEKIEVTTYKAK